MSDKPNVVLVHGGFVDGSGWQGVYDLLTADGYSVSIVQNPTLSLEGDAAATRMILDRQDGPTMLVGHSYGGAVITEAGTHESVSGLAYICAFAPDAGESVNTLIGTFPTDGPQPPILPPVDGFLFLDREKFHNSFAGDLPAKQAAFYADSQVPWGVEALGGTISEPAWRSKPSWYLITTGDVYSRDLISVQSDKDLEEALQLMARHQVRRLPVVENGGLVGIVAQADIALRETEKTGKLVEAISEPSEGERR